MVKKKYVSEEGGMLEVENERAPEIIEVSYSKAKQMAKRPMSEKQKENMQKLIEANRLKWENKKKEKEMQYQKYMEEREEKTTKVVVKPKRIYPPREKQSHYPKEDKDIVVSKQRPVHYQPDYEEDSDDDTSSDERIYQAKPKPKAPPAPKPTKPVQHERIKEIEHKINSIQVSLSEKPQSKYGSVMSKFFGK